MRKLICVLAAVVLMAGSFAVAEYDFSGLSFDQLLAVRAELDAAIWASDGWQEATVPQGAYVVGVDIPAGRWHVACYSLMAEVDVYPSESTYNADEYSAISLNVLSEDSPANIELNDGQYVVVSYGSAVFTPYTSAALGFK